MYRGFYLVLGIVFVGLGILGVLLPLLPGTVFFIVAAACFARSNPAFEKRIEENKWVGPGVIRWRKYGVIPPSAKATAVIGMMGGFLVFCITSKPPIVLIIIAGVFILSCALYVLSRPSHVPKEAVSPAEDSERKPAR
ncbi:DUF454 domain-containing protein [Rhodobacteraceae bacterium RKSG542]|uniref:YbaN family protein n=1 Tax=Pseudovibrio flavus TaxID=2529854 RepID=UPI0012BBCD3D|nr:YbaN family protein [Pseudovibrio flavus]MTI16082.1 DUF454 domain-containing protein [Pseudovibrio flavus]